MKLAFEWLRWLATIVALALSVNASTNANNAVDDQEEARIERTAQLCTVFRKEFKNDKRELEDLRRQQRQTVKFLFDVQGTPEANTVLVQVVKKGQPEKLKNIAQARTEAIDSRPPKFCDEQPSA